MSKYDNLNKQKLARKRANKLLKELFVKENGNSISTNFSAIMKSVDPNPNKGAFTVACKNAGLEDSEVEWLWAYLKNCKIALYDPIPEAASSGW